MHKRSIIADEIEINKKGLTRDRVYMQKLIVTDLNLVDHKVEKFQSIIQLLKGKKKISKKDQMNLIFNLAQYIRKDEISLDTRVLNKVNIGERNALLNYYAHINPNETKSFLEEYLPRKFPEIHDMSSNRFLDFHCYLILDLLMNLLIAFRIKKQMIQAITFIDFIMKE